MYNEIATIEVSDIILSLPQKSFAPHLFLPLEPFPLGNHWRLLLSSLFPFPSRSSYSWHHIVYSLFRFAHLVRKIHLQFFHLFSGLDSSFISYCWIIFHYLDLSKFIHSTQQAATGSCFHILTIMNKTAANIHTYFFVCPSVCILFESKPSGRRKHECWTVWTD